MPALLNFVHESGATLYEAFVSQRLALPAAKER